MKLRLRLALRNITRHRLRSILSIGMIAGAIASMIIFRGFSDFSLEALKRIAAENQYGHMQIAKPNFWQPGKESRKERMFELAQIEKLKESNSKIKTVSGRLSFFGLISNGDLSVGGKVIGIDTIGEPNFHQSMRILSGQFYSSSNSNEAMIGSLLAKQMNIKVGEDVTLLTNTIDGVMNAMDLKVSGIFSAGIDEIDAQVVYVPLQTAQTILDTNMVDIAVVRFPHFEIANVELNSINQSLKKISLTDLFAKSWRELATLYRQVDKFYGVQNKIIEGILLALTFLGILNTVSMTVIERTGEIGTLRSLGESRLDIIKQFILESLLVSFIGVVSGIILSIVVINVIEVSNIMTEMPGASNPFQIKIHFLVSAVVYSSILAVITTLIATFIPALRASKMDIVEALRKNI